jgi:hypothetical protein
MHQLVWLEVRDLLVAGLAPDQKAARREADLQLLRLATRDARPAVQKGHDRKLNSLGHRHSPLFG